jgi:hypothetical protein
MNTWKSLSAFVLVLAIFTHVSAWSSVSVRQSGTAQFELAKSPLIAPGASEAKQQEKLSWRSHIDGPVDRALADKKAKEAFYELNFFANGGGMHTVPGLIELYEASVWTGTSAFFKKMFQHSWGFNVQNNRIVGLYAVDYKKMKVGVLGCVVCHSGKAAGQYVIGLGNKNIDTLQLGESAKTIQSMYSKLGRPLFPSQDFLAVEKSALEFANLLSNPKIANLTQGMVPVSFIRSWFYKQANQPLPDTMTRGAVKIPSLWGYGEKRHVGQFSDGFGNGELPGWAIAVELTGGQAPSVVRSYLPKIEAAENLFSDFLPPKYPFAIDSQKAEKGRDVFEKSCVHCHGSYAVDESRLPVYAAPKWIPLSVVKTDADRLASNTEEFHRLVEASPLNDIIKANRFGQGFFAQRLVGIWARFPYLHNASVPTLAALLTSPEQRPEVFSLRDAGELNRFDKANGGLSLPTTPKEQQALLKDAQGGARDVYWTKRVGHSSEGHAFGIDLSVDEKTNLLEYLKTL